MGNQSMKNYIEEEHELVSQVLKTKVVTDPDSKTLVSLESLWNSHAGPTVIIFFRRWNCRICKMGAAEISAVQDEFNRIYGEEKIGFYGVGLEFVGFEQFRKKGFFKGKIYIDEGKTIYRALKYPRYSVKGWFNKKSYKRYFEAGRKGFSGEIASVAGAQLGGSVIVSPKGKVFYHKPQKYYGDDPTAEEILEKVQLYYSLAKAPENNDDIEQRKFIQI